MIHRIQVDFDIEADSHQEAVEKVQDFFHPEEHCPPDTHDLLILEENEEDCRAPECKEMVARWVTSLVETEL